MFPSCTWAAWNGLGMFSPQRITDNRYSPAVGFRKYQGQHVELEDFTGVLGTGNSAVVFDPCVYLIGWVASVRLVQTENSSFQVLGPVPTHRVGIVADADTAASLTQQDPFKVLLMGSDTTREAGSTTPSAGLTDVPSLVLRAGLDDEHTRLGVLTWSRLVQPSFEEAGNVMRIREMVEARRIVPECRCACNASRAASFDYYLEHPEHVLESRRMKIRPV